MTILYLELGVFDLERISGVQRCEAGDQDLERDMRALTDMQDVLT